MSDEPSSTPDLSGIDLSLSFAPSWAKESDSGDRLARLAAKHGGGDRPERSGGGNWKDRGPRSDGPRSDRRPPRRDGGDKHSGGGRPPRGGQDRREERRPERAPEPTLEGWEVQFLPDRHGVDGLAKQIKTSAKAYPLFDLARLVLEKSERYVVSFKRTTEAPSAIFQLKSDGTLWPSEAEAVSHALATQLEKFYRRERIAVEPPKGTFPFIAVCGMSGTLLGPPNYHNYQTKLIRLHAERFSNMSFDVFKSRIRMERDEALIEKWKEEQSFLDVFFPIDPSKPAPVPPAAVVAPVEAPALAESSEETPAADATAEAPVEESTPEAPAAEATNEEPPAVPAEEPAETVVEETPAAPAARETEGEKLSSLEEVGRHFREKHAAKAITRIRDRVVVPGPAALNDSSPVVLRLTRGAWEQLERFPLPLAHLLGQQLTAKGLQIFKTHDNITYAGVARPRFLDVTTTPVSDALRGMLEYIEAHRSVPRAEQWKALVELRPLGEGSETLRETAAAADLFWLLREGHVIDYAKRGLEAARRPKQNPPKQPKAPRSPKADAAKAAPVVAAAAATEAPASEVAASEPVASEPVASEPVASESVASESVASESVASESVASEPVASEPAVAESAPEEPETESVTGEPVIEDKPSDQSQQAQQ